jgi:hypothetical protein
VCAGLNVAADPDPDDSHGRRILSEARQNYAPSNELDTALPSSRDFATDGLRMLHQYMLPPQKQRLLGDFFARAVS